jgi:hypothetical protein
MILKCKGCKKEIWCGNHQYRKFREIQQAEVQLIEGATLLLYISLNFKKAKENM